MVLDRGVEQPCHGRGRQPVLGLSLEHGIADEHRQQAAGATENIFARDLSSAPIANELAIGLETSHQRGAKPVIVRSALQGRDRVAVGAELARPVLRPRDRPFRAAAAVERGLAGKRPVADQRRIAERVPEIVGKAAREAERILGKDFGTHAATAFGASPAGFPPPSTDRPWIARAHRAGRREETPNRRRSRGRGGTGRTCLAGSGHCPLSSSGPSGLPRL